MASIAGAVGNNGEQITGVAWSANLLIIKSTNAFGIGTASSYLKGLEYAAVRGVRIVNCSWRVFGNDSGLQSLRDFFLNSTDTLYVVAAGNEGLNNDCACAVNLRTFPAW